MRRRLILLEALYLFLERAGAFDGTLGDGRQLELTVEQTEAVRQAGRAYANAFDVTARAEADGALTPR